MTNSGGQRRRTYCSKLKVILFTDNPFIAWQANGKAEPQRRVGGIAALNEYTNKVKKRDATSAEGAVGSSGC